MVARCRWQISETSAESSCATTFAVASVPKSCEILALWKVVLSRD